MVTDLLPHLAELADEMCFIHSMTARSNTHGPAENQMTTGFTLDGFPSVGAWVSYALGTECDDLPAFVAIPDPRGVPQVGPNNWGSALPAGRLPGHRLQRRQADPEPGPPAGDRRRPPRRPRAISCKLLNERHLERHPGDTELAARIASYELAARMQLARRRGRRPVERIEGHARTCYGVDDANPIKAGFAQLPAGPAAAGARRALRAALQRRLRDGRGRRQLGRPPHLKADYDVHGPILDQPCAALLRDLKARGLLDDTLVVWVTEFGRMPTFQKGANGRDHNPKGFTVWLAGAGVKRAFSHGATDEFGYQAVEKVSHHLRPARDDPAPARPGSRTADLLPQRHQPPADRRAWCMGHWRLALTWEDILALTFGRRPDS